jgi:hypothetical protein
MEVVVNDPDRAMPLILGIGLANLSSCSHGTFTFLWVLDVPESSLPERLPRGSTPQFRLLKKIAILMLAWK